MKRKLNALTCSIHGCWSGVKSRHAGSPGRRDWAPVVVACCSGRLPTESAWRLAVSAARRPSILNANPSSANISLDIGLPAIPSRKMPCWLRARAWLLRRVSLVAAEMPVAVAGVIVHACRSGHALVA